MLILCIWSQILLGSDSLLNDQIHLLKGKKVGLIANHTALQANGTHILDAMLTKNINVSTIFSPEHGFLGVKDEYVADGAYGSSQIPIKSLYGKDRKPKSEDLKGVDVLVFDIQDIGVRFYTYVSTLALCMQAAAENKIPLLVCDRPNPLGGLLVDGPVQDKSREEAFISFLPMSLIHGMTMGELAKFIEQHYQLEMDLNVIAMKGWKREMTWDVCGLPWVNPSPNMRSFEEILLYPMVALFEGLSGVSVGRGTDRPFEYFYWPDQHQGMLTALRENDFGVWVLPHTFSVNPGTYPYAGESVQGIRFVVNHREKYDPLLAGMAMIQSVSDKLQDPEKQEVFLKWWGHEDSLRQLLDGQKFSDVHKSFRDDKRFHTFLEKRATVLIY